MTDAQSEHDIHTLNVVLDDLLMDYAHPIGHTTLIENAHLIEDAADKLALLVQKLRSSSTAHVVDLRTLERV
jgi:hypothetical protein